MNRYCRNNKAISGRLHDEMVMMDPAQGKYFALNPVATRVWDLLETSHDIEEICTLLSEEYDIESGQCRQEVGVLLEEMNRLGLIMKC